MNDTVNNNAYFVASKYYCYYTVQIVNVCEKKLTVLTLTLTCILYNVSFRK